MLRPGCRPPPPAAPQTNLTPDARRQCDAGSYLTIGQSWLNLGFTNEALMYFNRSLTLACEIKNQQLEMAAHHCLAVACIQPGHFDVAKNHLMNATNAARRIGDTTAEADLLSTMGALYSKTGDIKRALNSLHQALKLTRRRKDATGEMVVLGNLGNTYGEAGDPKKAIEYFMRIPLNSATHSTGKLPPNPVNSAT